MIILISATRESNAIKLSLTLKIIKIILTKSTSKAFLKQRQFQVVAMLLY